MLLAIDVGNSNIVMGIRHGGEWARQWRISTDAHRTADEYGVLFHNLFAESGLEYRDLQRVIIASVVPRLTATLSEVFLKRTGSEPLVVTHETNSGITIDTAQPAATGADLIAGAAGAWNRFGEPCIVVDFGTATTVMAVTGSGSLVGGAISAGLNLTVDALVGKAAQLPQIPLEPPARVISGDTVGAMQAGLFLGHLCMIEGLVARMKKEVGPSRVIATGGLAELLAPHTDCFDDVDPMLTLNGMKVIAERVLEAEF